MAAPFVSVVVLNWNGLADTRECLASLFAQDYPSFEIHVVDNGSDGGEAERLAEEFGGRIRLLRSPRNLGFTGGNNLALRLILEEGRAAYAALLNNDAEAAPDWLARLVAAAEAHPEAGLFASLMVFAGDPERIENAGIDLLSSGEALPRLRGRPRSAAARPARPIGACAGAALYRCAMLREIGLFTEDFFANFEDLDLSLRALVKGWDCRYVPGALVRHKLGRSIRRIRGREFLLRSQRNLLRAYWVNLPWQVLLLNLPMQVLAQLSILLLAPLAGQFLLASVVLRSRCAFVREAAAVRAARRRLAPRARGAWLRIWLRQRNFVLAYLRAFVEIVVLRRRRFFE